VLRAAPGSPAGATACLFRRCDGAQLEGLRTGDTAGCGRTRPLGRRVLPRRPGGRPRPARRRRRRAARLDGPGPVWARHCRGHGGACGCHLVSGKTGDTEWPTLDVGCAAPDIRASPALVDVGGRSTNPHFIPDGRGRHIFCWVLGVSSNRAAEQSPQIVADRRMPARGERC